MRYLLTLLVALSLVPFFTSEGSAKGSLELSPSQAPPGSRIYARGDGFFSKGPVHIELSVQHPPWDGHSGAPREYLPKTIRLGSTDADDGEYETTVAIPSREEIESQLGAGSNLSIWAMQESDASSVRLQVVREDFTLTDGQAPTAAQQYSESGTQRWFIVASATAVAGLAALVVIAKRVWGR